MINDTLGTLLKYQDDIIKMQGTRGRQDPGRGQHAAGKRRLSRAGSGHPEAG